MSDEKDAQIARLREAGRGLIEAVENNEPRATTNSENRCGWAV